ncbi:HNH endonuclease [Aquimarina sp. AD10]|uniref:HNH endonuclease signature motif containing protein n=1 Tax=Aquimarina sp. AD10 TaxID=1714849 RepID=UPI000E4F02CD|nr:HNH endonuclease signature motif containing protein [Aquimarina sp. AD10]AXT61698.1 HNH endonuclease [Aquimarina sp. AD10]RKN00953.1 HNH endonuclease [Aquimarina sp. AD10]
MIGCVPPGKRDPKRVMTKKEKSEMLNENGGKCEGCEKDITIDEAKGHHIKRHADGGPTTKENTAILCDGCHKEIHSKKKS